MMVATGIIKGRREESKKWEFRKARKHKSPGDRGFAKTFGSSKEKGGGGGGDNWIRETGDFVLPYALGFGQLSSCCVQ